MKAQRLGFALILVMALLAIALGPAGQSSTAEGADGPAATTTPSAPCGGPLGVGAAQWPCTFDDEFDGTALDTTKWVVQRTATSGYHSGAECFVDSPNNVSVGDGVLTLTARDEGAPFACDPYGIYTTQYTSGMVSSAGRFSQTYGRFEVRAAVPGTSVPGLQESFWLWPVNSTKYGAKWPASGELDIAEIYSQYADRAIPYIHYNPAVRDPFVTNTHCLVNDVSQMHTYTIDWTPATITISFDGNVCLTDAWVPAAPLVHPQPFDQPFFINLTQALGIVTNAFQPGVTPLPASTKVDYVRVWGWLPDASSTTTTTSPGPTTSTSTTSPATSTTTTTAPTTSTTTTTAPTTTSTSTTTTTTTTTTSTVLP